MNFNRTIVAWMSLLMLPFIGCQSPQSSTQTACKSDTLAIDTILPKRIVSCAPLLTEVMFALGQQSKLVGRTDYCKYPEGVKDIPSVGSVMEPSIETIISMKPDVVLTSTHFKREVSDKLNRLGIKTHRIFHQGTVEDAYETIRDVARLTGTLPQADSLIAALEVRKSVILASIPKNVEKPTVYYVVGYGKNGDFSCGYDTFIHQMITLAGGSNIAADTQGWNYSLEKLMTQNPDIIMIRQGWKEGFCAMAPYKQLKAVKNNHVFEINKDLLEINGPRTIDGLEMLVNLFYPAK